MTAQLAKDLERPRTVMIVAESQDGDALGYTLSLNANVQQVSIIDPLEVSISWRGRNVIHGRLSPNSDPASLMLYNLLFHPTEVQRRLNKVNVQLIYSGES